MSTRARPQATTVSATAHFPPVPRYEQSSLPPPATRARHCRPASLLGPHGVRSVAQPAPSPSDLRQQCESSSHRASPTVLARGSRYPPVAESPPLARSNSESLVPDEPAPTAIARRAAPRFGALLYRASVSPTNDPHRNLLPCESTDAALRPRTPIGPSVATARTSAEQPFRTIVHRWRVNSVAVR